MGFTPVQSRARAAEVAAARPEAAARKERREAVSFMRGDSVVWSVGGEKGAGRAFRDVLRFGARGICGCGGSCEPEGLAYFGE